MMSIKMTKKNWKRIRTGGKNNKVNQSLIHKKMKNK